MHIIYGVNIYQYLCVSLMVSVFPLYLSVCMISNQSTSKNHVILVKPSVGGGGGGWRGGRGGGVDKILRRGGREQCRVGVGILCQLFGSLNCRFFCYIYQENFILMQYQLFYVCAFINIESIQVKTELATLSLLMTYFFK